MYALGLGLSAESMAGAITVDGKLGDWGLNWSDKNKNNDWTPNAGIYYTVEDYLGDSGGFVGPGYGGQAYDAEALYVTWDAANLYVGLVTGHNPNTKQNPGKNSYGAGDFALNFWNGVEDGAYEFGIRTPHQFNARGNPANIGHFLTDIYQTTNDDWLKDPLWGTGTVTSLDMGLLTPKDVVGQANMMVKKVPNALDIGFGPGNHSHWVYEFSVAKSVFGDFLTKNTNLNVSWTMNCANDVILVKDDIPMSVDAPPSWALLGLTLPAVFWRRRRFSKR